VQNFVHFLSVCYGVQPLLFEFFVNPKYGHALLLFFLCIEFSTIDLPLTGLVAVTYPLLKPFRLMGTL